MVYGVLVHLLAYDPKTGIFTRKIQRGRYKAGGIAGRINHNGYRHIGFYGKEYMAHRLAWLYMTGVWPSDQIDHINGDRDDNRFENLREATPTLNGQNQRKAQSHNKSSGLLGVSQFKNATKNPWQASIRVDRKIKYLGTFSTPEVAHEAYLNAKRIMQPGCTI